MGCIRLIKEGDSVMSEAEKKIQASAEESVDDILAGILNPDGSFNDEFNGLFAKYVGSSQEPYTVGKVDISDRLDEITPSEKIEYESDEAVIRQEKTADDRIEDKLPESIKNAFSEAAKNAQRPEFTATGDVRYPTIGVGASEQRVVYDADWEESAKREAARRERVRQDRMLRGDSAYARGFVTRDAYINTPSPYIQQQPASPYIDPLSVDSDLERPDVNSEYFSSTKKPFFPEGFSVVQRNNASSSGKTERSGSGSRYYDNYVSSDRSWLQVEERPEKKRKGLFGKKKKKEHIERSYFSVDDAIEKGLSEKRAPEKEEAPEKTYKPSVSGELLNEVREETEGLRSTVAEIVDKYNKRTKEEEIKRLEELSRLEEKRREEELRERRRIEEIRALKNQMSPELCEAVEEEEENGGFDSYDDFSTEPAENKESVPVKKFGVVFDPAVFSGDEYIEKLGCDISEDAESAQNYAEKLTESTAEADETAVEKNTGKKKKRKR